MGPTAAKLTTRIKSVVNMSVKAVAMSLQLVQPNSIGYPASNRIAKRAGLRLGDRDIGSEMMRGVLGWFFRLNILLTVGFLGVQTIQVLNSGTPNIWGIMIEYYILGLGYAVPPIIFAILILPLVEDFAVVLYKKIFGDLE